MSERIEGTVIHWKIDRGYGFVRPEDGSPDVFLHAGEVEGGATVRVNTRVSFLVTATDRGPKAAQVRILRRDSGPRRRTHAFAVPAEPPTVDGLADVLTADELRQEVVAAAGDAFVQIAQRHGWVEG